MNALEQAQEKLDKIISLRDNDIKRLTNQINSIQKTIDEQLILYNTTIETHQKIVDEIKLKFFS